MSRKRKKHRSKQAGKRGRVIKPDEVFALGALTVARFGRYIQFSNEATPEQRAEMLKRAREMHREIINELEMEVPALQVLVARYDAVELMHRAAYELLPLFMKHRIESEYSIDENYSLPTVEYIQYLIARTPLAVGAPGIKDDEWDELWTRAKKIMELMNSYLFTRPPATNPPSEIDSLRFSLDQMRLMIRVHRYPVYLAEHLRMSLLPFEAEISAIHGASLEEIVTGLLAIDQYQRSGVMSRYTDTIRASTALQEELIQGGYNPTAVATSEETAAVKSALLLPEFKDRHEDAQEKARLTFTSAIFDITDLTTLPKSVLSLLSIKPGESELTSLTGPAPNYDDLSPLSISPLHYKPFVEVNDRFYTFYHSGFEDHMTEIVEADLFKRYPRKRGKLEKARSDLIELTAKDMVSGMVGADFAYVNAYYPNPDQAGFTELDGLIGADDVLFLIEVKSGGISAAAQRGAPKDLASTFSDLIFEGQRQSERAQRYIMSADSVNFYDDATGKSVMQTVRYSDYRKIFRIVVTKEELGWVGAQLARLSVLDPTLATSLPWHVSISDLRAVTELFSDNKLRFAHYLEQRLTAGENQELAQQDEMDHVGLYNKINHYHDLPVQGGHMTFDSSYTYDIDLYFSAKSIGKAHELPTQSMPPKMRTFLDQLAETKLVGRFQLGSHLLDLDTKGREQFEQVLRLLEGKNRDGKQSTIRMPISVVSSGVSFSLARDGNFQREVKRSAVQMEISDCANWLVVRLAGKDGLHAVDIKRIEVDMFTVQELTDTRAEMEVAGTQHEINIRKPGRNQPCYCGSGKNYKRCHGSVL